MLEGAPYEKTGQMLNDVRDVTALLEQMKHEVGLGRASAVRPGKLDNIFGFVVTGKEPIGSIDIENKRAPPDKRVSMVNQTPVLGYVDRRRLRLEILKGVRCWLPPEMYLLDPRVALDDKPPVAQSETLQCEK